MTMEKDSVPRTTTLNMTSMTLKAERKRINRLERPVLLPSEMIFSSPNHSKFFLYMHERTHRHLIRDSELSDNDPNARCSQYSKRRRHGQQRIDTQMETS